MSRPLRSGSVCSGIEDGGIAAVAFTQNSREEVRLIGGDGQITATLAADQGSHMTTRVVTFAFRPGQGAQQYCARQLTPRECERLQGFPDDWTLIPYRKGESSDSNRYRALGNSMAVPVMRWIGMQIARVEEEGG